MGLNFNFCRAAVRRLGVLSLGVLSLVVGPILLVGSLNVGAQQLSHRGDTSVDSGHQAGERKALAGIKNFAEVTPLLYRGSVPSDAALRALAESGVQIIVDTRAIWNGHERKAARRLGMRYVKIPWHCPFPKDNTFARFLKLIRDNPHKKIFIHCRLGDDRSGMMIAAYRMADQHWTAAEAMREMENFGFTKSHHAICPGLARYESQFPYRFKTSKAFKDLR
jgi:tyrosine-protein phosphatase SIW14